MKKLEMAEKVLADAVSAMDFDLDNMGLVDLVSLQNELRQMHEKIDEHKCAIGKLYDHIRTNVVPTKMDEEGIDNITVAGVGRVVCCTRSRNRLLEAPVHGARLAGHSGNRTTSFRQ